MNNDKQLAINGGKPVSKKIIPIHVPFLDENDKEAILQAFNSTFISGDGPECREFEKRLADYLGAKHVFFTSSCTAALDMAFRVMNFNPGKEVLVPLLDDPRVHFCKEQGRAP